MTNPLDWYRYEPRAGAYDEVVDERGQVRPAWSGVARLAGSLGAHGLLQRRERCDQLLAAHGATHVPHRELFGDTTTRTIGWHLDPLPFVIDREEWAGLSAAVAERAQLLAQVAGDLAEARHLVGDGVVPAAALFVEPSFLPTAPAGSASPLLWYGADLVRSASGEWLVLRDHTDVVQGVGEALLHRSVLSRALGDLGDRQAPTALTGHLADFRSLLAKAAPSGVQSPRTVVLTPDELSADYVATSYLSAQLGFHRTSAADLMVRDHRVYLRSLGGREPVDVVLRAVRAAETDPLASPQRGRGVPGLVAAERTHSAAVVNPVSGALVGSASLAPHLDAAVRHLSGRTPRLRSVPTFWCGDRSVAAEVHADPTSWVIEDVVTGETVFGSLLVDESVPRAHRHDWRTRLRLRPAALVVRRFQNLATVPVAVGSHASPGAVVLGVSVLLDGDQAMVMPGGFARVVEPSCPVAAQRTGWAKDVWVHDGKPVRAAARVTALPQVDLRTSLPTRSAEAMFWLGRAAEGAELRARAIRALSERASADPSLLELEDGAWRSGAQRMLAACSGSVTSSLDDLPRALDAAVSGRRGLIDQLDAMLLAASSVREFLSTTTGRVLADMSELRRSLRHRDAEVFEQLLVGLAAFAGLTQESTVRGPAWRLLDLGRRIERALGVLGAVEAMLETTPTPSSMQAVGETLLAAHESLVAYRRWHRTDIEVEAALDLLVRDDTNPRSVAFQIDRMVEHVASLPSPPTASLRLADAATALLEHGSITSLVLAVRGPILSLASELAEYWFSDRIAAHRLGEVER